LFSGGIDSTFIAFICKKLKKDFMCYSVGLESSEDLREAKRVAKALKLKLKTKQLKLSEAEKVIEKVTKILNEPDVMKVGVASVLYAAIEFAKKDKIRHFFSGLGSEEIFAGYQRHELANDINEECWKGLFGMYRRDIMRDLKIAKEFDACLLLPFLDKEAIINAMNISGEEKIKNGQNKIILRKIATDLGLKKEFAERKKRAAQYGSKFDRAILKLAKKNGFEYKKDYLRSLLK
jgi:asparagine synthase (glutamine-hydrolysing)